MGGNRHDIHFDTCSYLSVFSVSGMKYILTVKYITLTVFTVVSNISHVGIVHSEGCVVASQPLCACWHGVNKSVNSFGGSTTAFKGQVVIKYF